MNKWDNRFLDLACTVASWSKDPKRKVGCVIVDENNNILSTGFNGFPRGLADNERNLYDQELKRAIMIHAEMNALSRLNPASAIAHVKTMYCTSFPCSTCASMIVQHGINRLWVPEPDYKHPTWGKSWERASYVMEVEVDVEYWPEVEI